MIILKRPIITEKSMKLAQSSLYTFEVGKEVTKPMVAKEVTKRFNVKVLGVKMVNVKGKLKQQKKVRKVYRLSGFNKALVQIAKGQNIAIFETPKEAQAVWTTVENKPIKLREK